MSLAASSRLKRARAEQDDERAAPPPEAGRSRARKGASPTPEEEEGAAEPSDQHERKYRKQQQQEGRGQQRPTQTPPSAAADAADADADADAGDPLPPPAETIDALLENTMREIVASRAYPATACPSEVPRRLEALYQQQQRQRRLGRPPLPPWRELMEPTREVARRLAREGVLDITQRGRVVEDLEGTIRGPIRLRARPPPTEATAGG